MSNLIKLTGPINKSNTVTKQLVFFLHGWGSNGNDLIQISNYWKSELTETSFLAPNGPEECFGNPGGRQWFNILTEDKKIQHLGLQNSYEILTKYLDHQLSNYNLNHEDYFLVGFSQGSMLSLFTSVRRKCKGIVAYSGAYLDESIPKKGIRNDILLVHGELDNVVPVEKMYQAKDKLLSNSSLLETKSYSNLQHSINEEGLNLGCSFIKERS